MASRNNIIGEVILNYRVVAELASGGYGSVYRAQHIYLEREFVAIKLLHDYLRSEEGRESFHKEAEVLARLNHPYILPFRNFGIINDGLPYLITKLAPNGSLRERIQRLSPNLLPINDVLAILSQVGQALQHAHQQNIVHRDLKPENILFNAQNEALLADFGIAMMTSAISKNKKALVGTLAYMAPEHFKYDYSGKGDQYALGCIAYELVTGTRPFSPPHVVHPAALAAAWANKHMMEIPTPPRLLNSSLSIDVEQAILKAMAKQPQDRHADIFAFLKALGVSTSSGQTIYLDYKSAEAFYQEGEELVRLGRQWEAISVYQQAINLNPEFAHAYIRKGNIYFDLKDYAKASEDYRNSIRVAPQLALGHHMLGKALTALKQYKEALTAYEAAIRYAPDYINSYYQKIAVLKRLERYDETLTTYDQLIQIAPNPIDVHYQKIDLLKQRGKYEEAVRTYDQVIRLAPNNIDVYYQKIALLVERLERYEEALATHDQVICLAPNNIDAYYQKIALLVEQLKRYDEALAIHDQITQIAPDPIAAYYQKIELLERLERYDKALAIHDQITQIAPDPIAAYYQKIELLERLGSYEEVITTCDRIIDLDQNRADAYYRKGKTLEILENNDKRSKRLRLEIFVPNSLKPFIARLFPSPSYKQAFMAYERAFRLYPDESSYHVAIRDVLKHLGKLHQADEVYEELHGEYLLIGIQIPETFWFFLLPLTIDIILISIALGISIVLGLTLIPLLMWGGFLAVGLCLSIIFACIVSQLGRPYHLYNPFLLFLPAFFIGFEGAFVAWLLIQPALMRTWTVIIAFLVCFFLNAFLFFHIDILGGRATLLKMATMVKFLWKGILILGKALSAIAWAIADAMTSSLTDSKAKRFPPQQDRQIDILASLRDNKLKRPSSPQDRQINIPTFLRDSKLKRPSSPQGRQFKLPASLRDSKFKNRPRK